MFLSPWSRPRPCTLIRHLAAFLQDYKTVVQQQGLSLTQCHHSAQEVDGRKSDICDFKTVPESFGDSSLLQFTKFHGETVVLRESRQPPWQNCRSEIRREMTGRVFHELVEAFMKPKWRELCHKPLNREEIRKPQNQNTLRFQGGKHVEQRVIRSWQVFQHHPANSHIELFFRKGIFLNVAVEFFLHYIIGIKLLFGDVDTNRSSN